MKALETSAGEGQDQACCMASNICCVWRMVWTKSRALPWGAKYPNSLLCSCGHLSPGEWKYWLGSLSTSEVMQCSNSDVISISVSLGGLWLLRINPQENDLPHRLLEGWLRKRFANQFVCWKSYGNCVLIVHQWNQVFSLGCALSDVRHILADWLSSSTTNLSACLWIGMVLIRQIADDWNWPGGEGQNALQGIMMDLCGWGSIDGKSPASLTPGKVPALYLSTAVMLPIHLCELIKSGHRNLIELPDSH